MHDSLLKCESKLDNPKNNIRELGRFRSNLR